MKRVRNVNVVECGTQVESERKVIYYILGNSVVISLAKLVMPAVATTSLSPRLSGLPLARVTRFHLRFAYASTTYFCCTLGLLDVNCLLALVLETRLPVHHSACVEYRVGVPEYVYVRCS